MKLSVITPVFNAEDYLKDSIESVLNQEFSNFEWYICDDGSTDSSLEIIRSYNDDRIKLLINNNNIGYLRTMNNLFYQVKGDFIAFHDADDLSHPLRFAKQLEAFTLNEGIDILGTNYAIIDNKGNIVRSCKVLTDGCLLKEKIKKGNTFQKPSILFRRRVLEKIGGFREGFLELGNISEDYDWLLRASIYFNMANINFHEPLYLYRSVPTAMTKNFHNVEQLFGHKLVQFLFDQRLLTGEDYLDRGEIDLVREFIDQLKGPYKKDSSLFFRERAASLNYNGLYFQAIKMAWKGFVENPNLLNLRTLQYCIRTFLFQL